MAGVPFDVIRHPRLAEIDLTLVYYEDAVLKRVLDASMPFVGEGVEVDAGHLLLQTAGAFRLLVDCPVSETAEECWNFPVVIVKDAPSLSPSTHRTEYKIRFQVMHPIRFQSNGQPYFTTAGATLWNRDRSGLPA